LTKLSLVRFLLWTTNHKKKWIFGGSLASK
jgi:hypothetical protein